MALLYEAEARGVAAIDLIEEQSVASEFAREAIEGIARRAEEIDRLITERSHDWALERLASVDRALLRLGTWELLEHEEAPTAVILSEAVELAGEFSTKASKAFVNGVLAGIAADVGRS